MREVQTRVQTRVRTKVPEGWGCDAIADPAGGGARYQPVPCGMCEKTYHKLIYIHTAYVTPSTDQEVRHLLGFAPPAPLAVAAVLDGVGSRAIDFACADTTPQGRVGLSAAVLKLRLLVLVLVLVQRCWVLQVWPRAMLWGQWHRGRGRVRPPHCRARRNPWARPRCCYAHRPRAQGLQGQGRGQGRAVAAWRIAAGPRTRGGAP